MNYVLLVTLKMDNYTVGQYQYNFYFGEDGLSLKAINYKSLVDYRCDIEQDDIKNCQLIDSLETLHKILTDGFTNKNKDVGEMNIKYDNIKDEINTLLKIKFAYANEEWRLNLISVKDLINQEVINNKMQYFNKRLTDVEGEQKEINVLKDTISQLEYRLSRLENKTVTNNNYITYPEKFESCPQLSYRVEKISSALFVPLSKKLVMTVHNMTITGSDGHVYQMLITYLPYIDIDYYIQMCNCLIELNTADITGLNCRDLKFINNCVKITTLSLSNMPNLMDLSDILMFPDLKTLSIKGCRNINNLKILEKCKKLELLRVHSSINTGIFSEILSFRIEII